eukprot:TRINITY_DN6217_c0_g1_i1.p1 TRINITY_DN6217_c0_g1~~TRINITY_DN6217_c0_g1_i1.p1  ORF type:complete len:390 (-),score=215.30 TRINITY_DN6217_c0_g1_i1:92-1261(-)
MASPDTNINEEVNTNISSGNPNLVCRMYEQKFPEIDDLVMVCVRRIADVGAYVSLLEYNNIEGMIQFSELSRRRIRSVNKLIRVGKIEVAIVLRVDQEKGYIDLSKRRVSPEESKKLTERFNKSKTVHSIMRHVAEVTHTNLEDLYTTFGWPLYKKYKHAYDAFRLSMHEPTIFEGFTLSPEGFEVLKREIQRRLTAQPIKLRADFEISCFSYEGVDAVKSALLAGQGMGTTNLPVQIKLVAPPLFVATATSLDKEKGIEVLNAVIIKAREEIEKHNGNLVVKQPPRAVSENDDRELSLMLQNLALKNKELSGDDDNSDNDDDIEDGSESTTTTSSITSNQTEKKEQQQQAAPSKPIKPKVAATTATSKTTSSKSTKQQPAKTKSKSKK